ncbi:ROK family transcriptional regulator [Micromonospora sp. WMMD1102]|uniref:ROK family transcriptional regulator n=1 Tax=Micromonospora sp. WMMD1102 TaxID=3016105 RepID=UPI0024158497|nr:ROK family transcriptional regulator [Micromonospora sp. WMMD1102]MDG4785924.1 ROK family transcriptional regulator [Micromonospora sp. WMMD1102]
MIRELRARGPMTRADLVRVTGLSKPTVTSVVAHLESLGCIGLVPPDARAVPARAPVYEYGADRGQVLGIDVGAGKTLLILADLSGRTLASTRLATLAVAPDQPERFFGTVRNATDALLDQAAPQTRNLMAVVAGTPGVVSPDGVVTMAPQLPGWDGLHLVERLRAAFDCLVVAETEATLSLEAERSGGVAQGIDDALFVHLGIGIGAGLLLDGRVHRGAHGGAGEIGQMPYRQWSAGRDPGVVPLEAVAGGGAIRRSGREAAGTAGGAAILELAGGDVDRVEASTVFAACRAGDPVARAVVDAAVDALAWGIAAVGSAIDPRTVILGGGMSRSADLFLDRLADRVREWAPFSPEWAVSNLGDEAVALGAVNHAANLVEQELVRALSS